MLARDSLELVRDSANDNYSVYANSVHALAESLRKQYKLEESGRLQNEARQPAKALPYLQRWQELKQKLGGPRGAHLVSTLVEISAARRELGDMKAATTAFAQAESIARESIPPTDKRHVQVFLESAQLSLARKDPAAAVPVARSALALIDQQDPGRLSMIQCVLAEALARTGQVAEARELLNSALATRRRTMPADHWMIAETQRGCVSCQAEA